MATIWLVRHGEVAGNDPKTRAFAGWHDLPLTAKGEAQAEAVAARLAREPVRAVFSSDLHRAANTARRIAEHHSLEVQLSHGLREVNYGLWEGVGDAEILRDWAPLWQAREANPLEVAPPEGESYGDLWVRLAPVWAEIVQHALKLHASEPEASIVVAGHNGSLRAILFDVMSAPLQNARRITLSNCGLSRLEVKPSEAEANAQTGEPLEPRLLVRSVNETAHLQTVP
jgi:broad specificity phosphatase PhoE